MCLNPLTKRLPTGESFSFGCGKCVECSRKVQREWRLRMSKEIVNWKFNYFLTLTYDEKNLPRVPYNDAFLTNWQRKQYEGNLSSWLKNTSDDRTRYIKSYPSNAWFLTKKSKDEEVRKVSTLPTANTLHLQNWLKRCRISYERDTGERAPFKYFACSEYGPATMRPHYHVLIMSNIPLYLFTEHFVNKWTYGNVDWKRKALSTIYKGRYVPLDAVAGYVSKYIAKPTLFEAPYVNFGLVEKPKRFSSKGIGMCYVDELKKRLAEIGTQPQYVITRKEDKIKLELDFSRQVQDLFKVPISTKKGIFFYGIPRYWREKLYSVEKRTRYV